MVLREAGACGMALLLWLGVGWVIGGKGAEELGGAWIICSDELEHSK